MCVTTYVAISVPFITTLLFIDTTADKLRVQAYIHHVFVCEDRLTGTQDQPEVLVMCQNGALQWVRGC